MRKYFVSFIVTFCMVLCCVIPINAAEPRVALYVCSGPFNQYTKTGDDLERVKYELGVFASPGSTLTVNKSYARTITSSINFNLFPEVLEMGYEDSITAGVDIGWSKTNNTSAKQELVIVEIYDTFRVTKFSQYSEGYCNITAQTNIEALEGWMFDLK